MYLCNKDITLTSRFVKELDHWYTEKAIAHKRYVDKNININAKIIIYNDNIHELNIFPIKNNAPDYCLLQERIPYEETIKDIAEIIGNNSKLLLSFPKYIDTENVVRKLMI